MIEINRNYHKPVTADHPRVKIVGLGGAGCNVLDRLLLDGVEGAEIIAMNTDIQSLTSSVAQSKVQLGHAATRGLGAGGDPELGLAAADEAMEEIRQSLDGATMVFLCAGLGGGTGSGASPMIANIAKEQGALVIAFATMPFTFEGKRRAAQADESLAALQDVADIVICFENDKMGDAVSPKAGIHQAFATADHTISQSVRAISDLFRCPGLIHIGFDDLATALRRYNPRCVFGFGEADGDNRAHEALSRALKNPLMERGKMLNEAHNILVNVAGGSDMTLNEVQILMDELGRHINDHTQILFGTVVDPKLNGRMSVTIITSLGEPVADAGKKSLPRLQPDSKDEAELLPSEDVLEDPQEVLTEEESVEVPVAQPVTAGRKPRVKAVPASHPEAEAATPAKKTPQERQETLQFEQVTRGRFEKSEPTIVDGQDLDVPTFMRRNVRLK